MVNTTSPPLRTLPGVSNSRLELYADRLVLKRDDLLAHLAENIGGGDLVIPLKNVRDVRVYQTRFKPEGRITIYAHNNDVITLNYGGDQQEAAHEIAAAVKSLLPE